MAYNIGEKPGSYLCPNCGYRAGEVTAIARRDGASAWQPTYTVKSLRPHFAGLMSATFILILAGLMFASGFATKALLSTGPPIESPSGSSTSPTSGDSTPDVKPDSAGVNSSDVKVSAGNPKVIVWVNTNSGVYHCANTRWYGNTKNGKYMTQQEAQSKGYRPAYGSACG